MMKKVGFFATCAVKNEIQDLVLQECAALYPEHVVFGGIAEAKRALKQKEIGAFIIRKSSQLDAITVSYYHAAVDLRHVTFFNTARTTPLEAVNSPGLAFISISGMTLMDFLSNFNDLTHAPSQNVPIESCVMILSTQYSAITATQGIRNGGTGATIKANINCGLIHMHRMGGVEESDIVALQSNLSSGGLLIITGHGGVNGDSFASGGYVTGNIDDPTLIAETKVRHPAIDFVRVALAGQTLPPGSNLNVLLYICNAAKAPENELSFAEQIANGFAERGVSTHVIASTGIMGRMDGASHPSFGDVAKIALGVRAIATEIQVLRTDATVEGEIIHQEIMKCTDPYVITDMGCGPRNNLEQQWVNYLETHEMTPERFSMAAKMMVYFFSTLRKDAAFAEKRTRATNLLLKMPAEHSEHILQLVKSLNPTVFSCLDAIMKPRCLFDFDDDGSTCSV